MLSLGHIEVVNIFHVCAGMDRVNHSKNAVVKPQVKPVEVGQREVMEAVRKAQAAISQQIEPGEC